MQYEAYHSLFHEQYLSAHLRGHRGEHPWEQHQRGQCVEHDVALSKKRDQLHRGHDLEQYVAHCEQHVEHL